MKFSLLFRSLFPGLLFLSVLSYSLSQDSSSQKRFRGLSWNGIIQDVCLTQSELPPAPTADNPSPTPDPSYKEVQLTISPFQRSAFYKFDPAKPLKFVRHQGKQIQLVATVDLSTGPAEPLLFFLPGSAPSTYSIRVLNDDPAQFPGGSFWCYNFSRTTASGLFDNPAGKTNFTVQPNGSQLVKPTFDKSSTTFFSVRVPSKSNPVYSSAWSLNNDVRYLVFFIDDPTTPGSVIFLRVSDSVREMATPAPNQ